MKKPPIIIAMNTGIVKCVTNPKGSNNIFTTKLNVAAKTALAAGSPSLPTGNAKNVIKNIVIKMKFPNSILPVNAFPAWNGEVIFCISGIS